jgi:alpha-galactosidase
MNKPQIRGSVEYRHGSRIARARFGGSGDSGNGELSLKASMTETENGIRFDLTLRPLAAITITKASFDADLVSSRKERVYLNGYQSWTDSKEFDRHDVMKGPSRLLAPLLEKHKVTRYADYEFQPYPRRRGVFHGCSYGYVRPARAKPDAIAGDGTIAVPKADVVRFFGSLDENSGFTFFHVDLNRKRLRAVKDCEGLAIPAEYRAFSVLFFEGTVDESMDAWFREMRIVPRTARPASGWTSWYNYYQRISEKVILDNLEAFAGERIPIDIFQIDDGYQTAVGDWLSIKPESPHGMKYIADRIKAAGLKPGIWVAPFAAETDSETFRKHPDWFITDDRGRPYHTGSNWSGFFSLDFYNPEARDYLRKVFDVILNDWGFDLVKLDFLYGECVRPRNGKTRGTIMGEAMDFLRECVGEKEILGCGVPLWSAFGKVEYCRIGTDIDLQWHNRVYGALIHREFPSTKYALQNSIFRQHLDGRAFVNDPDVFLLRHDNISLTEDQKMTVFTINTIFGNLLFTSDNIAEYAGKERDLYLSSFPMRRRVIRYVDLDRDFYTAVFSEGGRDYILYSNQGKKARRAGTIEVPPYCVRILDAATGLVHEGLETIDGTNGKGGLH